MSEGKYTVDYPIAYHTVDIAIIRNHSEFGLQILMVQKKSELNSGLFRLPGGFIDTTDDTAEEAAAREADEETKMKLGTSIKYLGTAKIDDKRYRDSPHKIITSLYKMQWKSGQDGVGYDDVALTKWVSVDEVLNKWSAGELPDGFIAPPEAPLESKWNMVHVPLVYLLQKHYVKINEKKTKVDNLIKQIQEL